MGNVCMVDKCSGKTVECVTAAAEQWPGSNEHPGALSGGNGAGCPLKHGTVYAGPYPGYVHGRCPAICRYGCTPSLRPHGAEESRTKLLREAREFQALFHKERGSTPEEMGARIAEIEAEVAKTGTYVHTFEELQQGCRIAWRNTPKCANRKFWNTLEVLDKRHATTSAEMYQACVEHMMRNIRDGASKSYVTVFSPVDPSTGRGPRIWSDQLVRFAASFHDEKIIGDPANLGFTEMVQRRFGWTHNSQEPFEVLPLVLQATDEEEPSFFPVPTHCAPLVNIWHPDFPFLAGLDMKWCAVPQVSNIVLDLGGLRYSATPFNGWFASTEVVRDLADENRYNMLPAIAQGMGLPMDGDRSLWKDQTLVALTRAVVHSFAHADFAMVDHHTMIENFYDWYKDELRGRGYIPGNWKWLIPPISSSQCRAYLNLNKMTEYTLKPAWILAAGWRSYEKEVYGKPDAALASKKLGATVLAMFLAARLLRKARRARSRVLLVYASVNGTTRRYAGMLATFLGTSLTLDVLDAQSIGGAGRAARVEPLAKKLADCDLLLVLSPSYGNGEPPAEAEGLLALLASGDVKVPDKAYAVLGFGNSSYQKFCGAATLFDAALEKAGGLRLIETGRCDEMKGCQESYEAWVCALVRRAASALGHRGWWHLAAHERLSQQFVITEIATDSLWESRKTNPPVHLDFVGKDAADARHRLLEGSGSPRADAGGHHGLRDYWVEVSCVGSEVIEGNQENWSSQSTPGTALVKLAFTGPTVPYAAGDHAAVIPAGCQFASRVPALCGALAGKVGLDAVFIAHETMPGSLKEEFYPLLHRIKGKYTTMRQLLLKLAGLGEVVAMVACAQLAPFAAPQEKDALLRAAGDSDVHNELVARHGMRWADVFLNFPSLAGKVDLLTFLALLPVNRARLYSIASSHSLTPGELHLIVSRLVVDLPPKKPSQRSFSKAISFMPAETKTPQKLVGVASNFLTCMQPGDKVLLQVRTCRAFHLWADSSAPLVFVGAGSGIAPLRGFWQEREALAARGERLGPAVLIYGCRTRPRGQLAQDLAAAEASGALSRIVLALSAEPGAPKAYVQHVIEEQRTLLKDILGHASCHVYVCGWSAMAEAAKLALAAGSQEWLAQMKAEGRLHEDTYGFVQRQSQVNAVS